jgi:GxxExxY protein
VEGDKEFEEISREVIGAAIEVHRALGPGLLESAYEHCLCHELKLRGINHERQVPVPVFYKGLELDCAYRLDLVVDRQLVVEIKAVDSVLPVHTAQLLTYLKLTGIRIGLLMNFHVNTLRDGIKRVVL